MPKNINFFKKVAVAIVSSELLDLVILFRILYATVLLIYINGLNTLKAKRDIQNNSAKIIEARST